MLAAKKINEFGVKRLAEAVGRDLSIVYRWVRALKEGRGIKDANKRLIIAATANTPHAISWSDFEPTEELGVAA